MIVNYQKDASEHFVLLTSAAQLAEIDSHSSERLVFILKHSTRCGISHAALEHYENFATNGHDVLVYYLDLLMYREISNTITDKYGVAHSSPQVLVIHEGRSIRHATHYAIDQKWLLKAAK